MEARKGVDRYTYRFFIFFPDMNAFDFWGLFCDTGSLLTGIFCWLQCVRPSHLVHCSGNIRKLSPNFPRQFARQFDDDQLYIGNPYRALVHNGSLVDSTKAWKHFIKASTGVTF